MPTEDAPKETHHHSDTHHEHHSHTQAHEPSQHEEEHPYRGEVQMLLEWHAPSRPFQKRSKEFYVNSLLIIIALEVILFLFKEYPLMLVIVSLAFVSYALSSTPPDTFYCRISTEGLIVGEHFYLWQELYDFYFKRRNGQDMLHVRTKAYLPGELVLMLGDIQKEQLKQLLLAFLPYREIVKPTFTEKAGEWVVTNFPLEKSPSHPHHKPS
jgi:hypothetical protein